VSFPFVRALCTKSTRSLLASRNLLFSNSCQLFVFFVIFSRTSQKQLILGCPIHLCTSDFNYALLGDLDISILSIWPHHYNSLSCNSCNQFWILTSSLKMSFVILIILVFQVIAWIFLLFVFAVDHVWAVCIGSGLNNIYGLLFCISLESLCSIIFVSEKST
jgi:hypothetical protein